MNPTANRQGEHVMKSMHFLMALGLVCAAAATGQPAVTPPAADGRVPLATALPKPVIRGTAVPITIPNVEPVPGKRPDFMVPAGTVNLARGKKATSSDTDPVDGELSLITDGDKSGEEGFAVELNTGKQWVQIDLGQPSEIHAILVWHFHSEKYRVYHDVVVQVAEDADFLLGVKTLFNNDTDNSLGLGVGKNRPYIEDYQGKLIDAKGVRGRYVRLYSQGNTSNKMNHYIEVEVWGKPVK